MAMLPLRDMVSKLKVKVRKPVPSALAIFEKPFQFNRALGLLLPIQDTVSKPQVKVCKPTPAQAND